MVIKEGQQPERRRVNAIFQVRKEMKSWEALSDTELEEYEPILQQVGVVAKESQKTSFAKKKKLHSQNH